MVAVILSSSLAYSHLHVPWLKISNPEKCKLADSYFPFTNDLFSSAVKNMGYSHDNLMQLMRDELDLSVQEDPMQSLEAWGFFHACGYGDFADDLFPNLGTQFEGQW